MSRSDALRAALQLEIVRSRDPASPPSAKSRLKIRTIFIFQRFTAGRSSDACNARWEHVDWRTEEIWITNEKIQTPRRIHMPPPFFDAMKRWHEACGSPKGGYLFESSNGGRYAKRGTTFAKALRKALALAGFGPETHPELHWETDFTLPVDDHSIRRLAITAMAEAGVNHQTAMNLVGHRSPATHARYLRTTKKMTELPEAAVGAFSAALGGGEAAIDPGVVPTERCPTGPRAVAPAVDGDAASVAGGTDAAAPCVAAFVPEPISAVHDVAPGAARAASSRGSGATPETRPRAWPYLRSEPARPAPRIALEDRVNAGASGATVARGAASFRPRRRGDKGSKATREGGLTKCGADGTRTRGLRRDRPAL